MCDGALPKGSAAFALISTPRYDGASSLLCTLVAPLFFMAFAWYAVFSDDDPDRGRVVQARRARGPEVSTRPGDWRVDVYEGVVAPRRNPDFFGGFY